MRNLLILIFFFHMCYFSLTSLKKNFCFFSLPKFDYNTCWHGCIFTYFQLTQLQSVSLCVLPNLGSFQLCLFDLMLFSYFFVISAWHGWRSRQPIQPLLVWLRFACMLSHVQDCLVASSWTVAHQAPLSMGFPLSRILEWVAISFCRRSSWPRDRTRVSCIGRIPYHRATWEAWVWFGSWLFLWCLTGTEWFLSEGYLGAVVCFGCGCSCAQVDSFFNGKPGTHQASREWQRAHHCAAPEVASQTAFFSTFGVFWCLFYV